MFNTGQILLHKRKRIYEFNYSIKGPINEKQKVNNIIKDFYDYDYKLTLGILIVLLNYLTSFLIYKNVNI